MRMDLNVTINSVWNGHYFETIETELKAKKQHSSLHTIPVIISTEITKITFFFCIDKGIFPVPNEDQRRLAMTGDSILLNSH